MKRAHSPSPHGEKKLPGKKKAVANDSSSGGVVSEEQHALMLPEAVLFLKVGDFLHWKDCLQLGQLNKDYRQSFVPYRDKILRPLLDELESLCKSNVHNYCGKVYAPASKRVCTCGPKVDAYDQPERQDLASVDPRYKHAYDLLSIDVKCARMIHFLSTMVANMRPHLQMSLDNNTADPSHMPDAIGTIEPNWSLGIGHHGNAAMQMYPRRTALAFNIVLAKFAQWSFNKGHDIYFNQAFLGNGGIDPSGSGFGNEMCYYLARMLPFSNEKLIKFMRKEVLPSKETLTLLGPALSSRVILCAPFLDWIDENDNFMLPDGLEQFDGAAVQRAMDEWDDRDDGRGHGFFM